MQFWINTLSIFGSLMALAIFSNRVRRKAAKKFTADLKPNCLLSRWPLLFVTGPRSFFYHSDYWNTYTSFLAEHGYEVYKLYLPWNETELRKKRFNEFLTQQDKLGKQFHFFMDSPSLYELADELINLRSKCLVSLTEIHDNNTCFTAADSAQFPFSFSRVKCNSHGDLAPLISLSYKLHRFLLRKHSLPTAQTLGASPTTSTSNSLLLLNKAHKLAEQDLCE